MRSDSSGDASLEEFLARHPSFDGWQEEWDGVPLEFRTSIANEAPPRDFVGSVRAIVLRGQHVLLVHSTVPILSVGGRVQTGESLQQALVREVAEESGWRVSSIGVIGFIHCRHLDAQRPNWGRPTPDFIDPLFVADAGIFDPALIEVSAPRCELVPIDSVEQLGVEKINRRFLAEALRRRAAPRVSGGV